MNDAVCVYGDSTVGLLQRIDTDVRLGGSNTTTIRKSNAAAVFDLVAK